MNLSGQLQTRAVVSATLPMGRWQLWAKSGGRKRSVRYVSSMKNLSPTSAKRSASRPRSSLQSIHWIDCSTSRTVPHPLPQAERWGATYSAGNLWRGAATGLPRPLWERIASPRTPKANAWTRLVRGIFAADANFFVINSTAYRRHKKIFRYFFAKSYIFLTQFPSISTPYARKSTRFPAAL